MKTIKRFMAGTLGATVLLIQGLPVYGQAVSDQTMIRASLDAGLESVENTANIISDSIDSLTIESTDSTAVYEPEYTPVYTYSEPYVEIQDTSTTISVDEFLTLYGQQEETKTIVETVPVDTSNQEETYQAALVGYNAALAEFEAANQMIETTKEIEVEIIEEVTDEEGNVSEVVRTEIQTVTEMVPAGDYVSAQANLDAAKAALDNAQMALDAARNSTVTVGTDVDEVDQPVVPGINENEKTSIDEEVIFKQDQTSASSGYCGIGGGTNLSWTLDDAGVLTISGSGQMQNYYGTWNPPWQSGVKTAYIQEGVTTIGNAAFVSCTQLTSIFIPTSLTSIDIYAFTSCPNLKNVYYSGNSYAWGNIEGASDQIPSTATVHYNIKRGTCGNNLNWLLDDGTLTITGTGDMYDYDYKSGPWGKYVYNLNISSGATGIGTYALYDCRTLRTVSLPSTISRIGANAFASCTALSGITIPSKVTEIENSVFSGCSNLSNVVIPTSTTSIGDFAFSGCGNLTSITIPNSVTSMGMGVFSSCSGLSTVTLPNRITSIPQTAFQNCTSLTSITIPSSVTTIDGYAFQGCTGLTSVTIPDNVSTISFWAFYGCTGLKTVYLPSTVTSIKDAAFWGCSSLTDVYYNGSRQSWNSKGLYDFGEDVTIHCTDDQSVTGVQLDTTSLSLNIGDQYQLSATVLPSDAKNKSVSWTSSKSSIAKVSSSGLVTAMSAGTAVITVTTEDGNKSAKCTITVSNVKTGKCGDNLYWKLTGQDLYIYGTGDMTHYTWSDGSPWGSNIKSVKIDSGVTSIGAYAFYCSKLESVDIADTVKRIGSHAFSGCDSLISIEIPDGVTHIGQYTFAFSDKLTTVMIPSSVTSIGSSAFYDCGKLSDVYYQGTKSEWNNKNLYPFDSTVTMHFLGDNLPFKDVYTDDWYYSVAKECYETGLINGTSATTFSPMQTMTRAMVVTILWRMDGQPKTAFNNKFKDVTSSQWYATSISWAEKSGVVHGYGDGTFKPDAAVTREQVAVMLANYAGYKKVYKPGTVDYSTFPDGNQVSGYAQAGMKWALTNGIISGNGAGYLNPKKSATRAEGAAMLLRMKNWL